MAGLEFNDTLDQHMSNLNDVSNRLERLSEAFYTTGNEQMGWELEFLFNKIVTAEKELTKAYRKDISDKVNAQNAQFGKTLSALSEK